MNAVLSILRYEVFSGNQVLKVCNLKKYAINIVFLFHGKEEVPMIRFFVILIRMVKK